MWRPLGESLSCLHILFGMCYTHTLIPIVPYWLIPRHHILCIMTDTQIDGLNTGSITKFIKPLTDTCIARLLLSKKNATTSTRHSFAWVCWHLDMTLAPQHVKLQWSENCSGAILVFSSFRNTESCYMTDSQWLSRDRLDYCLLCSLIICGVQQSHY